jgi:hypothetical protein
MSNLKESIDKWQTAEKIILFDEVKEILCCTAYHWAGVPLLGSKVKRRAMEFVSMVDGFGAVGPRYWKGKAARSRTEEWIKEIIDNVRAGKLRSEDDSAVLAVAFHRELNGRLLDSQMATIKLISLERNVPFVKGHLGWVGMEEKARRPREIDPSKGTMTCTPQEYTIGQDLFYCGTPTGTQGNCR